LVEVLVILGLLGVLIGLLLPAVQNSRAAAVRIKCQDNMRQVGVAQHNHHAAHGRFPPADGSSHPASPARLLSWHALLLPYIGQEPLWTASAAACQADPVPYHNPPHVGYATAVPEFSCPADDRLRAPLLTPDGEQVAFTSYLGVIGGHTRQGLGAGLFYAFPGSRLTDISDGASQTLAVGERPPPGGLQAGQWYNGRYIAGRFGWPNQLMEIPQITLPGVGVVTDCTNITGRYGPGRLDNPCDRFHFWSLHPGGANWLFADGAVRFLRYEARDVLPALATRAGGEAVTLPD
jgi:prepilin-type processing-associated H-X9-DG protein